ncbi:hypothetical protein [Clavibacter tessellarius]|uniref:hypothetical protein n=1 Tax=Clavibacter tessellarius TaxID=31965 RepID=UPI00324DC64E
MNTSELITRVNANLSLYGSKFEPSEGASNADPANVSGVINGVPVRLEFSKRNEHPEFDYSIWLYSATGEPLGRGNGGPNFELAIDTYQWTSALADLEP